MREDQIGPFKAAAVSGVSLSILGLAEWLFRRPSPQPFAEALEAFCFVVVFHFVLGGAVGIVVPLVRSGRGSLSVVLALCGSLIVPIVGLNSVGFTSQFVIYLLAAIPVFWVALLVTARVTVPAVAIFGTFGGLLVAGAFAVGLPPAAADRPVPDGPSVLLISLDTVRADRVGVYGHTDARTPTLDSLAASGAWFSNAQSHTSWTGPSHLSILTGRQPADHGALYNLKPLPPDVPTLVDAFGAAGYTTGAFVGGFPLVRHVIDPRRAFDHYDDEMSHDRFRPFALGSTLVQGVRGALEGGERAWRRNAAQVSDRAIAWLETRSRPFFAWIHYYDAHLPYEYPGPPGPTDGGWFRLSKEARLDAIRSGERVRHLSTLYDVQVTAMDRELARVIEAARAQAGLELWIIVTSDHGESFGEHGLYFKRDAYEVTGRVPLIVVAPPGAPIVGGRRDEPVGLIDIAPTVIAAAGLDAPESFEGFDLSRSTPRDRVILKVHSPETPGNHPEAASARNQRFRLIERSGGFHGRFHRSAQHELYDLLEDAGETRNLFGTGHPAEAPLAAWIARQRANADPDATPPALDERSQEGLRALGYLE